MGEISDLAVESRLLVNKIYQENVPELKILINEIVKESRMILNLAHKNYCENKL